LLLSDGLANAGDSSRNGLVGRAERLARSGAVLTTMGIGDDFDQPLMTALSDAGQGNFHYIARLHMIPKFFEAELETAKLTVASQVTVHFVHRPYVELLDAAGYPLERSPGEVRFRPGALFANQQRKVWLKLRLPTDQLSSFELGSLRVSYEHGGERREWNRPLAPAVRCVADAAAFDAGIVREVWEAAVANEAQSEAERALSEALRSGSRDEVERTVQTYRAKNAHLAGRLNSRVVEQSIEHIERRANEVKAQQQKPRAEREVDAQRMRARATMVVRRSAYKSGYQEDAY